jgi:hypothetical protein
MGDPSEHDDGEGALRMEEIDARRASAPKPALRVIAGAGRRAGSEGAGDHVSETEPRQPVVAFDRRELNTLFNLYGAKVSAGEWRDYALDFTPAKAVFSVYRRTSDMPLYRIEKIPELARRQGLYAVFAADGRVLRRGHELGRVIRALDRGLRLVGAE